MNMGRALVGYSVVWALFALGCETKEDSASLESFIMGLEDVAEPTAVPPQLVSSTDTKQVRQGSVENCVYETYEGTALYESLVSFDPNVDALWPGAVVQSESLSHGLLTPIALPRAPGTVTLSNAILEGDADQAAGPSYSRTLANPSLAGVQDAVADILSAEQVNIAAKASFLAEEAHSLNEAALDVGVSVDWLSGNVSGEFSGSWSESQSTFVVRFVQAYYTVSFAAPEGPGKMFAPETTVEDAEPYMQDGNPPGYVSSVTYGRTLLLKVESSHSAEELKAALDSAFSLGLTKVDADVSAQNQKVLDESTFTALALGGDPDAVVALVSPSADRVEALRTYFESGAGYSAASPGVPIAYSVRRLADNRTIKVGSSIDYEVPNCTVATDDVKVHLTKLNVIADGADFGQGDITYTLKVGDKSISSTATAGSGDSVVINQDVILTLPQTHGTILEVGFEATEGNNPAAPLVGVKQHTFQLDPATGSGSWTQAGAAKVKAGLGNFELQLEYTLTP